MMQHQTKFAYKRSSSVDENIQTKPGHMERDKWTGGHANSDIPSSHTPNSVMAGAYEFCWYTADEFCLYSKKHCSWSVSIKKHIHCGWSLFLSRNKYTVTYVCLHPETTEQKSPPGKKEKKKV